MESRRPPGRKTARIVTILFVLVGCCLFGCGGGQQATPVTNTVAHSVQLNWMGNNSIDVLGYNVYRGTQSGGPYERLNPGLLANPDYLDTAVLAGQTYYYTVTTVSAVKESGPSAEAVAVIPTP